MCCQPSVNLFSDNEWDSDSNSLDCDTSCMQNVYYIIISVHNLHLLVKYKRYLIIPRNGAVLVGSYDVINK